MMNVQMPFEISWSVSAIINVMRARRRVRFLRGLAVWLVMAGFASVGLLTPQPTAGDEEIQTLVKGLSAKEWQNRASSAREFARLGPRAVAATPSLVAAINDRFPTVREAAATALGDVLSGAKNPTLVGDAVTALLGRFDDRSEVQAAARSALLRIGPPALPPLLGLMRSDGDPAMRHFGAELLDGFQDIPVEQAKDLMVLSANDDRYVRLHAADALTRMVANCAVRGRDGIADLPTVRTVEQALRKSEDLRRQAGGVTVSRQYLELLAAEANKSHFSSFLEKASPYIALYGAILSVAFIIVLALARYAENARKRLSMEIRQISSDSLAVEKNAIARAALKRFVTMPEREVRPGFTIASAFADSSDVSGDFYNWFNRTDGSTCAYLVDVEGSGIDAAIQATHAAKVLDRTLTGGNIQPAEALLENADRIMHNELSQANIAVTMNMVEIYPRQIRLANAGMPAPLLFRRGQAQPQQLQAAGVYVGGGYSRFPVQPRFAQTPVSAGDLLVLFSDGVVEASDQNGTVFGRTGIESVVTRVRDSDPESIARDILAAAALHSGNELPVDDQTVLVVRFEGLSAIGGSGAQTVVEVCFDESEAEFTLTNAIDSGQIFASLLQERIRGWVDMVGGCSSGAIWCAIWELLKNAVVHGSKRGEVISLRLRASKNDIAVEIEQPAEWRGWDEFLGDARKRTLSESAPGNIDTLGDHLGTAVLLRLADAATASLLGRRLTLLFKRKKNNELFVGGQ